MFARKSKIISSARFEWLCVRYRPDVLRFALWLARDGAIAEDVVQEIFMRAWRAIDSLADPEATRPWLLAIARREHARLYERKRPTIVALDDLIAADDPALASAPKLRVALGTEESRKRSRRRRSSTAREDVR